MNSCCSSPLCTTITNEQFISSNKLCSFSSSAEWILQEATLHTWQEMQGSKVDFCAQNDSKDLIENMQNFYPVVWKRAVSEDLLKLEKMEKVRLVWSVCQETVSSLWKEHDRTAWCWKLYFNKPQDLWNNSPWVDTTKMEMFAHIEQHHMLAYQ